MTYTSLSLVVIYNEFLVLGRQGKCIKFDSILVLNCVSSGVGICTQDWCMRVQSNVDILYQTLCIIPLRQSLAVPGVRLTRNHYPQHCGYRQFYIFMYESYYRYTS